MHLSDILLLSGLGMLGVLAAFLLFRVWPRERPGTEESDWDGHGIEVAGIANRIRRIRDGFVSAAHLKPREACCRKGLVASAKRRVRRLGYFRKRARQSPAPANHDSEPHAASQS